MFRIAPTSLVAGDVFLGDLAKGAPLDLGEALRLPLRALNSDRVGALAVLRPVRSGLLSSPREHDIRVVTESHVAALAFDLESEHSGFRASRRDPEIKPAGVVQNRRPLRLRNLDR
jgi:hypothetical protein